MTDGYVNRYRLGIIGGLGPLASADLYEKITRLTPAECDQDHVSTVLLSIPQTPDRTAAIHEIGPSPLPHLLDAVQTLNRLGVELVAISCNTAHHWYDQLVAASDAPILHIAQAAVAALRTHQDDGQIAVLATRGVIASGFYQRKLVDDGFLPHIPDEQAQGLVDCAIAAVKAGNLPAASAAANAVTSVLESLDIPLALLACTELPIAWSQHAAGSTGTLRTIDVNLTFAQAIVQVLSSRNSSPHPKEYLASLVGATNRHQRPGLRARRQLSPQFPNC